MPSERLLGTLLRSLQIYAQQQDTARLLSTAASLLASLNNPLNVTLLTNQLLCAPAIWTRPDGVRTSLTFLGVFHSAAIRYLERERAVDQPIAPYASISPLEPRLSIQEWVRAVIKGADERSLPSQHLLVLGGLLIGFGGQDEDFLSTALGCDVQSAFVKALNLSVVETPATDEVLLSSITLALNHAFAYISDLERSNIDYDRVLPILMNSTLHSNDGLRSGYFLGAADAEIKQISNKQFNWPKGSGSFRQIETTLSSPLVSSLGPLSRLIAHTIEQVRDPWLVMSAVEDLADFSRRLLAQWRQNKLSEIDASEEAEFLHEEARRETVPAMWRLLKATLFAVVVVLRSATGRVMGDGVLAADDNAPHIAQETLNCLRGLSFIHSRLGSATLSQYTFTYLAAIDILAAYPQDADLFLQSIAPSELGHIPVHPLERCLDLYFLNTAEHFTLILSPQLCEGLLIAAATPYLTSGGNPNLLPIFEAAHSNMLAVFSAPQNVEITSKHLPFYVDALFRVFPHNLSPRQFRLAFKSLIRVTSPPSKIAGAQPMLAATLLELVHERALHAPSTPLPNTPAVNAVPSPLPGQGQTIVPQLSEQAVLISTLIDALPALALDLLPEWLPLSAAMVNRIPDTAMREHCKKAFWETLVGGEMDPERSQICVAWWTGKGGREMLLYGIEVRGDRDEEYEVSGALPVEKSTAKL